MGGRGAASAATPYLPPDALEKLPYNIASYDDKVGGGSTLFWNEPNAPGAS